MASVGKKSGPTLRVVDLFCGPGGLSEGLRQAGCDTVFALDYDKRAVESFAANHPEAVVVHGDIRNLDPSSLPDCDIIVGGPPCIEFSTSKGGRANILDGLELVQAYLRVVHYVQPRWWIMENIPRITKFLPETIPLSWIGIDDDGTLTIPQRGTFNAAEYGVPQRRKRFLMGCYPPPKPTHTVGTPSALQFDRECDLLPAPTLGEVLDALPRPGQSPRRRYYTDPNYGFSLPVEDLTDQSHETWIDPQEVKRLRDQKLNHPYMGKMSFPDDLSTPARTVVATQLGRETLVIEDNGRFRRPTVREVATIQSFPFTYQFFGSPSARYRLVGDAVPPLLGYAIGRLIQEEAGQPTPMSPIGGIRAVRRAPQLPPLPDRSSRKAQNKPDRRFAMMIPGKEVRGCRAEFDNRGTPRSSAGQAIRWRGMLHVGEGASRREMEVTPEIALSALLTFADYAEAQNCIAELFGEIDFLLESTPIASQALQSAWVDGSPAGGPDRLVAQVSSVVDRWFPRSKWDKVRRPAIAELPILRPSGIRIRIAVGLVLASRLAELANDPACNIGKPLEKRWAAALADLAGPIELIAAPDRPSLFQSGAH